MGEVGLLGGLNGRVGKTGAHLYVLIFKKELEGRAKRGDHEGWGQEAPSPLNIAPTKAQFRQEKEINDYWLKVRIPTAVEISGAVSPRPRENFNFYSNGKRLSSLVFFFKHLNSFGECCDGFPLRLDELLLLLNNLGQNGYHVHRA